MKNKITNIASTKYCRVCKQPIPEKRVALGYSNTCVIHSSIKKFSGVVVADGKSTTWLNVIRDEETAKHIKALTETRGRY